ncbi:MAG: plastocyanin/azurin family copper-binding protein [Ilumatobacter sp.]|uniref:cupredoxin domain-containing protein n=1 Tax=Ilumatobacter sp. TaxID=1967498 RepID=UPI0026227FD4|nr:plastocyanin/azurin family copper-binding protein [Ilumatobacter sp.]MDJ0770148.1 plastocyanin/azurin family copper-binding protein [Ilumatobacter sp.]
MTRAVGSVLALVVLLGLACADDGNDHAYRQRRAEQLAAEFRASQESAAAAASSDPGAGTTSETPVVEPTGLVVPVIALDNTFRPEIVEISVGDEVLWENRGMNEHNVLRVEGDGWGVEVDDFQPGDVYAHVFTEPGEFRYFCSIHGTEDVGMIGTVIVVSS